MRTSYSKSTNAELSSITLNVINISDQSAVPGIADNVLLKVVKTSHEPFHVRVLREPTVKVGDELIKRNRLRMSLSNKLKTILSHTTHFSNTAEAAAAKAILDEWNKLKKPNSSHDYDEVNTYMSKLLPILKSDALRPHFETLGYTARIADVEQADTNFRTLSLDQTRGNAELRLQGSASQYRPAVEKALSSYLKYITVMKDQPGYDVLYSKLNEAVKTARKPSKKQSLPEDETMEEIS